MVKIGKQTGQKQYGFFSYPNQSSLAWICQKLNLDLGSTVKKAYEICPEVKINLSIENTVGYHRDTIKKAAQG